MCYRHIELFGNGKCLLVVDDLLDKETKIYLDDDNRLDQAIQGAQTKKKLNHNKAGLNFLLAVSETKRLIAVLSQKDVSRLELGNRNILIISFPLVPSTHLCHFRGFYQHTRPGL